MPRNRSVRARKGPLLRQGSYGCTLRKGLVLRLSGRKHTLRRRRRQSTPIGGWKGGVCYEKRVAESQLRGLRSVASVIRLERMPGAPQPYQTIWNGADPSTNHAPGGQFLLRTTLYASVAGRLMGMKFYRDREDPANHIGVVIKRAAAGQRAALGALAFPRANALEGRAGWNTRYMHPVIHFEASEWFDIIVWFTGGSYYSDDGAIATTDLVVGDLVVPHQGSTDPFGFAVNNSAFGNTLLFNPNTTLSGALAGIDLLFLPD